jgi:16S rRNA processing protein RimM
MEKTNYVNTDELVEVGKIVKPFGVMGELIVIDYGENYPLFISFKNFYIYVKENGISILKEFKVKEFRGNSSKIILNLDGIESREESEKLSKNSLYVTRSNIPLNEGEYLFLDFIECDCFYEEQKIGKVIGMPNYGTCDMFEIKIDKPTNKKKGAYTVFVPYFKELIDKIDLDNKIIYFNEGYKDYL